MAHFIELTRPNETKLTINVDNISHFAKSNNGKTFIVLKNANVDGITVDEFYDDIKNAIETLLGTPIQIIPPSQDSQDYEKGDMYV